MMVSKLVAVLLLFSVVDGPTSGSTQGDITAKVGDTVILPAQLQAPSDLSKLKITWTYGDWKDRFVYQYHNEKIMDRRQLVNYKGRASINLSEIANGTFSLKLINVTLRDAGQYSLNLYKENLTHNRMESVNVSLKIENITGDPKAPSRQVPPKQDQGGLWMTSPPTEPDQKTGLIGVVVGVVVAVVAVVAVGIFIWWKCKTNQENDPNDTGARGEERIEMINIEQPNDEDL